MKSFCRLFILTKKEHTFALSLKNFGDWSKLNVYIRHDALRIGFYRKSTRQHKALDMRTYDIDHNFSLFAYYYEDHVHLKLRRYKEEETSLSDWKKLKVVRTIYPDINLSDTKDVYMDTQNNQVHIKTPFSIYKRSDY